jgi:serine/threonine protein kinase
MINNLKSRRETYYKLNMQLAHIDKRQLDLLFDDENDVPSRKTHGWGTNHIIEIGNSKVFVKRIPVTDIEYQNMFSTKNHYNIPTYYNYGVGSAGFGAFRELVTHIKTTNWVLGGEIENFPLMYHYRIVPCFDKKIEIEIEKDKEYIEKWNNNKNIQKYIIARKESKYEIVLFLEYIPYSLSEWLGKNREKVSKVVSEIRNTIIFLQKKEIIHFDIHLQNIITDGEKMYLTDFGLVLDKNFDLSEKEHEFFKQNFYYDYGEFLCAVGMNLFSVYQKNHGNQKLKKYGIKGEMKPEKGFMIFLKNIKEINTDSIIKLDNTYIDFISKFYEIIILFSEFFTEMLLNNKKNTKYDHKKLIKLLKKTEFIPEKK